MKVERLLELLIQYPGNCGTFNQYRDVHPELDRPEGAEIRRRNLRSYLQIFDERPGAGFILVGEAAGYAGCRFSGIPFTCEAQLVGPRRLGWAVDRDLGRSSTAATPWVERSASMVWEALGDRRDCVLWNAFPWHPHDGSGPLSNRPPGQDLQDGLLVLRCLLDLYPEAQPYAIGRVAQRALLSIGAEAPYIRHPSRGGKRLFMVGVANLSQVRGRSPLGQKSP